MSPIVYSLPGNELLAAALAEQLPALAGTVAVRQFPDEETYLRIDHPVEGREVVIAATLDRPNGKLVGLYLLASNLRAAGAKRIVLVSPYLPYMRQDAIFHEGEGISAAHIGRWLSSFLDGIVTVDPHLHRIRDLSTVYSVPTRVVHAAPAIGRWIRENVVHPVLIGPDDESTDWVREAAQTAACRYLICKKLRHGDRNVSVMIPGIQAFIEHTPVLMDDIISSGATMIDAIHHLSAAGSAPPTCIGVHAVFADDSHDRLEHAGADRVVTCNTIVHATNAIDVHREIALATMDLLATLAPKRAMRA